MKDLRGSVAIITGASRGIGVPIAEALARRGARLVLAARSAEDLGRVSRGLEATGAEVLTVPTDVADRAARAHLVAEAVRRFGAVDILINNAGIVQPSSYERLSTEEIEQQIEINLTAPMALARLALPHMLERKRGHIVNIASIGGLFGIGWVEPYSATKHGLVGFTRALRMACKASGTPVSASVICPGFIDGTGMYADGVRTYGRRASWMLGSSPSETVVASVIKAIDRDRPEIIISPRPVRILLAIGALSPRVGEWLVRKLGMHEIFEAAAQDSGRGRIAPP
jgi:short-subunit dehydrogenase